MANIVREESSPLAYIQRLINNGVNDQLSPNLSKDGTLKTIRMKNKMNLSEYLYRNSPVILKLGVIVLRSAATGACVGQSKGVLIAPSTNSFI